MKKQPLTFPVVAISGFPRIGSMWSFNVARSLVQQAGLDLVPDGVPKSDSDMFDIARAYLKSRPVNSRCIIKVHSIVDVSRSMRVIRNRRDLRDRLYSYYRFMQKDMNEQQVLEEITWGLHVDEQYDQWPSRNILNIPYDSIQNDSIDAIRRIAKFVGLPNPSMDTLTNIDFYFSKQQVRKRIAETEGRVFDQQGNVKRNADLHAVVEVGSGHVRAFDVTSGFQSGHVSDYQPGDWEHLWTDRQKQMVNDALVIAEHNSGTPGWQRKIGKLHKWVRSLV